MKPGPTLNDTKDPKKRLAKLIKRRKHIKEQIAELQDKDHILRCEIAEIYLGGRRG